MRLVFCHVALFTSKAPQQIPVKANYGTHTHNAGYHGAEQGEERLVAEAAAVGFPLLVKAVSGGGGKGMKLAHSKVRHAACLCVLHSDCPFPRET